MDLEFRGEIIYWRGPSPHHFVTIPEGQRAAIRAISSLVTYGWRAIPVKARIDAFQAEYDVDHRRITVATPRSGG